MYALSLKWGVQSVGVDIHRPVVLDHPYTLVKRPIAILCTASAPVTCTTLQQSAPTSVGAAVGLALGGRVGTADGTALGASVGANVGISVSSSSAVVGAMVGTVDGAGLGAIVGTPEGVGVVGEGVNSAKQRPEAG